MITFFLFSAPDMNSFYGTQWLFCKDIYDPEFEEFEKLD